MTNIFKPFQASGNVVQQSNTLILTSSQIRNLLTVPVTLFDSPGNNKIIIPYSTTVLLTVPTGSAFVLGSGNINFNWYNGTTYTPFDSGSLNAMIFSPTTTAAGFFNGNLVDTGIDPALITNASITIDNIGGGGNISGNVANNNTLQIVISFSLLTF